MPSQRPCTTRYFPHCAVVLLLLMLRCSYSQNNCDELQDFDTCLKKINDSLQQLEFTHACNTTNTELYPMGSPGSLTCPVETGVSVNIVQWDYYNSNNGAISEAINERDRFTSPTNRLEISAVQPEDEGLYVCQVSENGDPAMPRFAGCIVVYGTMELVSTTSEGVVAVTNRDITLNTELVFRNKGSCGVRPRLTQVQLQLNGSDIRLNCQSEDQCVNGRVSYAALGNITIVNAMTDDAGNYRFGAQVSCPSQIVQTKDFVVTVTDAPSNTDIPTILSTTPPAVSPTPSPRSETGSSEGNVAVVASVVVVILVLVIGIVLLAITGAIWYRRKMQHTESLVKEHVYDHVKTLGLNGSNHEHIDADDNVIYTTAPSTIVGDRNSMLFDEVQLTERPTDQEGSI